MQVSRGAINLFVTLALGLVGRNTLAQNRLPHQTWIQGIGIDPIFKSDNSAAMYESSTDFIKACRRAGLKIGTDCKSFIDLDVTPSFVIPNDKSESMGKATTGKVLDAFTEALDKAQPGDQVILDLVDHGSNGFYFSSCIYMSPLTSLCARDVEAALKKRKAGVKVLVVAEACDSGAFTGLNSKEVCTFVASDKYKPAYEVNFWKNVNQVEIQNKNPVTLEDVRMKSNLAAVMSEGGGFGSQAMKWNYCKKEKSKEKRKANGELVAWVNYWPQAEIDFLLGSVKDAEDDFKGCSQCAAGTSPSTNKVNLAVKNILNITDHNREDLDRIEMGNCPGQKSDPQPLCSSIAGIKANFKVLTDLRIKLQLQIASYLKKEKYFYQMDKSISLDEAARGKLFEDLTEERIRLLKSLKNIQDQTVYEGIVKDYQVIADEVCADPSLVDEDIHILPYLTFTVLTGNRVPKSEKAYQEARECEKSFSIP